MRTREDITGQKFNKLTAIKYIKHIKYRPIWEFQCECGTYKNIRMDKVTRGEIKSCGCLRTADKTHGDNHRGRATRLHNIWSGMKNRCGNINIKSYTHITLCKEWELYIVFKKWALSHGYNDKLTIDRIDNNKGYYPENCRWTTVLQQARNKNDSIYLTLHGKTRHLSEWVEETGIYKSTILYRIHSGWSVDEALTIPPKYGQTINNLRKENNMFSKKCKPKGK